MYVPKGFPVERKDVSSTEQKWLENSYFNKNLQCKVRATPEATK